jgi:hypothetical protein
VLSRLFRRLFLQALGSAFEVGNVRAFGDLASLADPSTFAALVDRLRHIDWVVFAKLKHLVRKAQEQNHEGLAKSRRTPRPGVAGRVRQLLQKFRICFR